MQLIQFPLHRIIGNVLTNMLQISLVANDLIVIIPLPNTRSRHITMLVDVLSGLKFEICHDLPQRRRGNPAPTVRL